MGRIAQNYGIVLLITLAFTLSLPSLASAEDEEVIVQGNRTSQGYKIAKGSYVNIPGDVRLKQVAHNVIKQESSEEYIARKFEEIDGRLNELESTVEQRLDDIETRLAQVEKS